MKEVILTMLNKFGQECNAAQVNKDGYMAIMYINKANVPELIDEIQCLFGGPACDIHQINTKFKPHFNLKTV